MQTSLFYCHKEMKFKRAAGMKTIHKYQPEPSEGTYYLYYFLFMLNLIIIKYTSSLEYFGEST